MTKRSRTGMGPAGRLAAVLVMALLTGACAGDGEEVVTEGPRAQPGGGDGPLFVEVRLEGGFVPEGHDFRALPHAVVYADGRAFSPGPMTLQYPGPAVAPLQEGRLTEAQVQEVLAAAEEAGLTDEDEEDFGEPFIADAGTTLVTVVVDGEVHTTRVYALAETGEDAPGVSAEQKKNRGRVRQFLDTVSGLVSGEGAELHEPDRFHLLPLAVDPAAPEPEAPEPEVRDWPLEEIDLEARQCVAVSDQQAQELRDALSDASENTRWRTADGELYTLAVRALLPHEAGCPGESPPQ